MEIRKEFPTEPRLNIVEVEGLALNLPFEWTNWSHHELVAIRPELERCDQTLREHGYQLIREVKWTPQNRLTVIVIPIWMALAASCIRHIYRILSFICVMGLFFYLVSWMLPYIGYLLVLGGGYVVVDLLMDAFRTYVM
jgi:hypothetical protein